MIKLKDLLELRIPITVYSTRKQFSKDGTPVEARVRKDGSGYYAEIDNKYDKSFKNKSELNRWLKKGGYELLGYDKAYTWWLN